jgi:hypothetical protein
MAQVNQHPPTHDQTESLYKANYGLLVLIMAPGQGNQSVSKLPKKLKN